MFRTLISISIALAIGTESSLAFGFGASASRRLPLTLSSTAAVHGGLIEEEPYNAPISHQSHDNERIPYKHLFRYHDDISLDSWLRCADPESFLLDCGFSENDLERLFGKEYDSSRVWERDVYTHWAPKVCFLVNVLGGGTGRMEWAEDEDVTGEHTVDEECNILSGGSTSSSPYNIRVSETARRVIPASYFDVRLEKTLAPQHAYLQHHGLPHGSVLLTRNAERLKELLKASSTEDFARLCHTWAAQQQLPMGGSSTLQARIHTLDRARAWERVFARGLLGLMASDEQDANEARDLQIVGCSRSQMRELLVQHGANLAEVEKYMSSL